MTESTKKKSGAVAVTSVLLIGTGVAVAYWTAGGTGTGTAKTGSVEDIAVVQLANVTDLAPGADPVTLSGRFDNTNANKASVYVGTVTAAVTGVQQAAGAPEGTCTSSDYEIQQAAMSVGEEIPYGVGVGEWSGAQISFNNKNTNQDACKGATVEITYTVS